MNLPSDSERTLELVITSTHLLPYGFGNRVTFVNFREIEVSLPVDTENPSAMILGNSELSSITM